MRVQLFSNGKGLIYGEDPKRIGCDRAGTLNIGGAEVVVAAEDDAVLPLLFNGSIGRYAATYTDAKGSVFDLGMVEVRNGRIVPPSQTAVELMELRSRIDELQAVCDRLGEKLRDLANIFDTNSLNFLIK